jgi:long-subunit fatty acid transport protein
MKWMNVLLLAATALWSQTSSGLTALQIGSSGRATAMAEAATAVSHDASAPFWNPSGLAWLEKRQVHFTHNEWIQGINHEAVSFARPGRSLSWGLHAMLTSVNDIEQRNTATEEPLSTFSAHTIAVGFTLARKMTERLSVGVNLRYLYEKIYVESADGYAADLGIQYRTPISGLEVGATVQNFGTTTPLHQEKMNLPETMRLGAGYTLPLGEGPLTVLLAVDYVNIFDKNSYVNAGIEIRPLTMLAMRSGYASNHSNRDFSMGFGLLLKNLTLDYAYVPFKQGLGNTHQFSVTIDL